MYKPTPPHILFDTLVTGLTCTASATTWWGLARSGKALKVSVWQEFMDIGKDRFSLLSSCADLVFNEGNDNHIYWLSWCWRYDMTAQHIGTFPDFWRIQFQSLWIGIENWHYRRSSPLEPKQKSHKKEVIMTKRAWWWWLWWFDLGEPAHKTGGTLIIPLATSHTSCGAVLWDFSQYFPS